MPLDRDSVALFGVVAKWPGPRMVVEQHSAVAVETQPDLGIGLESDGAD